MILNHIILAMLWIVYCVLHSVLASEGLKKKLRQRMKNYRWYRLWYTTFAFIFLIGILIYQLRLQTIRLFALNELAFVTGIIFSFSGLVLMSLCVRKYFMNLSGLRSLFVEDFSNELQLTGMHRHVRHPLYLGTFCFIWGLLLVLPYLSLLVTNIIITIYTLIGIELEEKKLIIEFGERYSKYRAEVPKLIPSLKPKQGL